ncbi:MAG: hypothetical protein AAF961_02975 [Planctomycetota bacterium]
MIRDKPIATSNRLVYLPRRMTALPLLLLAVTASRASADLILAVEDVTVSSPGTAFADVFAIIDDNTPRNVAIFNVSLGIEPKGLGVRLENAVEPLVQPLFPGVAPAELGTGDRLRVDGLISGVNMEVPIEDGDRLFRLSIVVPRGIPVGMTFDIDFSPTETFLFEGTGEANEVRIDQFVSGTIRVVPEPSAFLFLSGIAAACGGVCLWRTFSARRRAARVRA